MLRARALAALVGALAVAAPGVAHADDPPGATAVPREAGRGAVVIALGAGADDAARALAREVYRDPTLRPPIDEATAQVLVGTVPARDAPARVQDLAALRGALAPDPGSPATRRALESLAAELGAAAVVAVHHPPGGEPRGRVVLAGAADGAAVELVGRAEAGTEPSWTGALATLHRLVPPPAVPAPPAGTGAASSRPDGTGAGRPPPEATLAPRQDAPAVPPAPPAEAQEPQPFYERPWFWVALGAFAAAGLTALVVTTTADGDEASDSVRFRATIPQARVTFP